MLNFKQIGAFLLENAIKEKAIKGGGIKLYVQTRWTTMYECANSIVRLKPAFNYVSIKYNFKFYYLI